jgi:hypothetical protein
VKNATTKNENGLKHGKQRGYQTVRSPLSLYFKSIKLDLLEYILFIPWEMIPGSAEEYIKVAWTKYKYDKKLQSSPSSPSIHLLLKHFQESETSAPHSPDSSRCKRHLGFCDWDYTPTRRRFCTDRLQIVRECARGMTREVTSQWQMKVKENTPPKYLAARLLMLSETMRVNSPCFCTWHSRVSTSLSR